jgi:hypothetical protein
MEKKHHSRSFGFKSSLRNIIGSVLLISLLGISCSKIMLKDPGPPVLSTSPANNTKNVAVTALPGITLNTQLDSAARKSATFVLMQGASTVPGTMNFSGKTVTFTPAAALLPNKNYTCRFSIQSTDALSNPIEINYTWGFTTQNNGNVDSTPPTVNSVTPAENAQSVPGNSTVNIVFSEAMDVSTITSSTILVKNGASAITGTVTCSGNTATFTPSAALTAGTVYTVTVTTGVKDAAGNMMSSPKNWNFTTAVSGSTDKTPPTVVSVVPAENATAIPVNTSITVNFSEAMDASTISASTISLKQGSTSISGTVTYSGTAAKFTPSTSLTAGLVYTATVSGVKDVAGNVIAASKSWTFTTAAATCGSGTQSFASDVFPIVKTKCMPCHSGSNPPAGISLTNYTQVKAIGSKLDMPSMYSKMGVTACEQAVIKAWLAQGSQNN